MCQNCVCLSSCICGPRKRHNGEVQKVLFPLSVILICNDACDTSYVRSSADVLFSWDTIISKQGIRILLKEKERRKKEGNEVREFGSQKYLGCEAQDLVVICFTGVYQFRIKCLISAFPKQQVAESASLV